MQRAATTVVLMFVVATSMVWGSAATVSLTPVADTSLLELQPDFNLGGQEDFPAGTMGSRVGTLRTRVLLRFDLAGKLPTNAIICAAAFRLSVSRVPDEGGVNSIFGLHRMLREWGEGAKKGSTPGGAKATAGEATWNARFFPDVLWGSPGGQADLDYASQPSSSERVLQFGTYEFEFGPNQLAELQTWLREPATNFGWMLRTQTEEVGTTARRFAARENGDTNSRPTLLIDYITAPMITPPKVKSISLLSNKASITFTAQAGIKYTLEMRNDVVTSLWQPLAVSAIGQNGGDLTLVDESLPGSQRFYRVVAGQ